MTAIEDYAGDEFQASLSELSVQFVKSGKQRQTRLKVPRTGVILVSLDIQIENEFKLNTSINSFW